MSENEWAAIGIAAFVFVFWKLSGMGEARMGTEFDPFDELMQRVTALEADITNVKLSLASIATWRDWYVSQKSSKSDPDTVPPPKIE